MKSRWPIILRESIKKASKFKIIERIGEVTRQLPTFAVRSHNLNVGGVWKYVHQRPAANSYYKYTPLILNSSVGSLRYSICKYRLSNILMYRSEV